jgi:malonyl-CoA decarboxylase
MSRASISDLLSIVADRARRWRRRPANPNIFSKKVVSLFDLCTDLLSRRGEASGTAIALDVLNQYACLDEAGRLAFFDMLAKQFGPDRKRLEQVVAAWHNNCATESDIHFTSEPRRQELFRRLNRALGGKPLWFACASSC